jgi:hypothetical protein
MSGLWCQEVIGYVFTLEDEGILFPWNVRCHSSCDAAPHVWRPESSSYVNIFLRYEHYFQEFGRFRREQSINCKENCHEDPMFNQLCSYKMPFLADAICQVKPMKNAGQCDHTLHNNDVTCNKKNSDSQSTVKSLSSVMLQLEANKDAVSVPPVSER